MHMKCNEFTFNDKISKADEIKIKNLICKTSWEGVGRARDGRMGIYVAMVSHELLSLSYIIVFPLCYFHYLFFNR